MKIEQERSQLLEDLEKTGFFWKEVAERHRSSDEDYPSYYERRKREFRQSIPPTTKIYLDLNIWIHFRDTILKREKDGIWNAILHQAKVLVDQRKALFVISTPLFLEVQKQPDPKLRNLIYDLMGFLSQGVAITNHHDLIYEEALFTLYSLLTMEPPHHLFQFDSAALVLGIDFANSNSLDLTSLNKLLVDMFYHMSFSFYCKQFIESPDGKFTMDSFQILSEKLNLDLQSKEGVRADDFDAVLREEFGGVLRAALHQVNRAIFDFYNTVNPNSTETFDDIVASPLSNMFYNIFDYQKLGNMMPSLQITAGLHAVFRTSNSRKYKQNHLFDFRHGESALPYCDFFFTDGPFAQLLNDKPLEYSQRFNTVVESNPEKIHSILLGICPPNQSLLIRSFNFINLLFDVTFLTAIPNAFGCPTITTNFFPLVTAV
jgi:hypothetical protein